MKAPAAGVIVLILLIFMAACGGEVGSPQSTASTAPDSSVSPSPVAAPFKTIVLKGTGTRLTNQFALPEGNYKVSWAMHAVGGYCCPNLIFDMVGQDKTNLDASQDPTGSTLFQSGGGFFRIQTDASGTAWTITIEQI